MANMTSQPEYPQKSSASSQQPNQGAEAGQQGASAVERAAAGASALGTQQLRKARERVDEQISSQRERVTGRVRTLSRALRGAGETLEDDDLVSQCLHFASDKVERVAGYVEDLTPDGAADDLRGIARDRPAWFFGGAFVLGLALGRFARATGGAERNSVSATRVRGRGTRAGTPKRQPAGSPTGTWDEPSGPSTGTVRTGALRP